MEFRMRWKGTLPLIMHDVEKLIDPRNPITKQLKELTGKRNKTDADYDEIGRLEFYGGMYYHEKLGPYLPARSIRACIRDGAAKTKEGQKVKRGVLISHPENPLLYTGPRSIDLLWADENYRDVRAAKPPGSRGTVIRTRPIFREWAVEFEFWLDEELLNPKDVERFCETAGRLEGIGDYRPDFGHFVVEWMKGINGK